MLVKRWGFDLLVWGAGGTSDQVGCFPTRGASLHYNEDSLSLALMIVQAKGSPAGRLLGVMPGVLQAALLECSLQEGCATYCRRCACFNCSRADRMKGCGMQVHVPESTHAFPAYTRLHTCTGNCRLRQSAQGMGWHLSGALFVYVLRHRLYADSAPRACCLGRRRRRFGQEAKSQG